LYVDNTSQVLRVLGDILSQAVKSRLVSVQVLNSSKSGGR